MKYKLGMTFVIVVLLFVFIAGCTSSNGTSDNSPTVQPATASSATPTVKATPTPAPTATPVQAPANIDLSGNGQQATSKFHLEKGLSVFKMKYQGSSNFIVWLLDDMGSKKELLANLIGDYDGSHAFGITKAGDYLLDVDADTSWTVTILQPRGGTGASLPDTFEGAGFQTSQFIRFEKGLATFKMKYTGTSNFIVWLMDDQGTKTELLVNTIGDFDGSKAVGITKAGNYVLSVDGVGDWNIDISQ